MTIVHEGRKLRVFRRDEPSRITWVYGWRDVIAWPLPDEALRRGD